MLATCEGYIRDARPVRQLDNGATAELDHPYSKTLVKARAVLDSLLAGQLPQPEDAIRGALSHAVLTADQAIAPDQRLWLEVLRR